VSTADQKKTSVHLRLKTGGTRYDDIRQKPANIYRETGGKMKNPGK